MMPGYSQGDLFTLAPFATRSHRMKPGSPEWIQESLAKLERLESARDALQNMLASADDQEEAAQLHALTQLEQQIADLYQELEQVASESGDESDDDDFDPTADASFSGGALLERDDSEAGDDDDASVTGTSMELDDDEPAPRRGLFARARADSDDDLNASADSNSYDDDSDDDEDSFEDDAGGDDLEVTRERDSTLAFRPGLAGTSARPAQARLAAFDDEDPFAARPVSPRVQVDAATRPYSTTNSPIVDDDDLGDTQTGFGSSFADSSDYDVPDVTAGGGKGKLWLGLGALVAVLGIGGFLATRGPAGNADGAKAAAIGAPAPIAENVAVIEAAPVLPDTEGPPPAPPGATAERSAAPAVVEAPRTKNSPREKKSPRTGRTPKKPKDKPTKPERFKENADPL
jgi:hypothetical protein